MMRGLRQDFYTDVVTLYNIVDSGDELVKSLATAEKVCYHELYTSKKEGGIPHATKNRSCIVGI